MKKILYILNISNGVNSFSISSIRAAKQCGLEFHLAGNFSSASPEKIKMDEKEHGIKLHQIDLSRSPYSKQNIIAYKQVVDLIERENIDYIHCNTPVGGLLGRLAGKKCKVEKVIYQAHGFHFYKDAPIKNWLIYYPVERWLAHYTDVLITINNEDYKAAKKFKLRNNGDVYDVPGVGIDASLYMQTLSYNTEKRDEMDINENDIVCISMGDLIPRKNYNTAIEAIAQCRNKHIHYLICGNGPELENLKKLAVKLNIEKQIHFLGYRTDIKELLSVADIFLFTTLQEGLPRSMMEAMASGLPCIASRIRGNVDLLEDGRGGYLFSLSNVDELADRIMQLLENSELRKSMGICNLERIKEFDFQVVQEEIKEIYKTELVD